MKLLRWAIGGASAYVIYKYSIGRKARGEDVFTTPEKAVEKIARETASPRKPAARKPSARKAAPAKGAAASTAEPAPVPETPKRKRAPRKKPAQQ